MTAPPPWTGWNRNRSGASRSRQRRQPVSGKAWPASTRNTGSISSIPRGMWISPSRSRDHSGFWIAPARCSAPSAVSNRNRKRYGARQTNITCRDWPSSTKWIAPERISWGWWTRSGSVSAARLCRCNFQSAQKTSIGASSTWCAARRLSGMM